MVGKLETAGHRTSKMIDGYSAAVSTPKDPRHHYAAAGQRHLADGWHLLTNGRKASADHLAGLAGECVLKAILLSFLGAQMHGIKPGTTSSTTGKVQTYGHLPDIWNQVSLYAQGRAGAQFGHLINSPNPFSEWEVAARYLDDDSVRLVATVRHLKASDALMRVLQRAQLAGALP